MFCVYERDCCCTHGEGSLIVHLSHRHVSHCRVHHEDLLVVAQLELRVEGVDDGNGPVGLLEGDGQQEPVGGNGSRRLVVTTPSVSGTTDCAFKST